MNRTLASLVAAIIAASLWLLWNFEHENTSIRAPWTGLTFAASVLGFVACGVVGRGWRAPACAGLAAAAAVLLVDPLVWHSEPGESENCDPACIPPEVFLVSLSVAAALLATIGILLRRAHGLFVRGGATARRHHRVAP